MNKIFKNKKIIIFPILLLIIAILVPIGFSLFSDEKQAEKHVKIGEIKVVLEEDPEWEENEDELGIKKYTKAVKGVSAAEGDAYVRVRCIPIVEYYKKDAAGEEGQWITAPVPQENIIVAINADEWVNDGEYWYYTKVLKGFEKTDVINIDWQVTELPTEISGNDIRTDVRVILEYAQASNNMWKEIFQIDDLPAEVERIAE